VNIVGDKALVLLIEQQISATANQSKTDPHQAV
jgi:hypothetical protein